MTKQEKGGLIGGMVMHNMAIQRYLNNPRYCKCCNKLLPFEKRNNVFCDSSCAAKYNNTHRKITKEKIAEFNCIKCGKTFLCNVHTPKSFRICPDCEGQKTSKRIRRPKNDYEKILLEWLRGEDVKVCSDNGKLYNGFRREFIKYKGGKCEKCGWDEINPVTGNHPLQIHHIDGNCYNNSPNNLQLLCPNCHSLTDNYCRLNKNCKRKYYIGHKK